MQGITNALQQLRVQATADQAWSQKVVESFDDWATTLTIEKKKTTFLHGQLGEMRQKHVELESRIEGVVQDVVRNDQEGKKLLNEHDVRSKDAFNANDLNARMH